MPEGGGGRDGGTIPDPIREGQARPAQPGIDERAPMTMKEVVRRENMFEALRRVRANDGAAGVDGMTVTDLDAHLKARWPEIREALLSGQYVPQPVRKVEIPKPDGKGVRMLGIPTVMDRLIQQALLQVLQPTIDPTFSDSSFGFRPGRGTHDAIRRAQAHVREGFIWVVDMDLEKFFDRVNHDVLMARVAWRVQDKAILLLIRRFLQAGIMEGGIASPRVEGTPQGGPLSPFLSNILLHELDAELEQRGHRFVRYADDCNIYVKSQAAGERVLASLEAFLRDRLRLKVNREKSAVAHPWERKFLGYTIARHGKKLQVAPKSIERLRTKLQPLLQRAARGRRLRDVLADLAPMLRGWVAYFRLAQIAKDFEEIDKWIRKRLRCAIWRQWKKPRTRLRELRRRGIKDGIARGTVYSVHGPWATASSWTMSQAIPAKELAEMGLVSLLDEYRRLKTA